jgi:hypothetical protein
MWGYLVEAKDGEDGEWYEIARPLSYNLAEEMIMDFVINHHLNPGRFVRLTCIPLL